MQQSMYVVGVSPFKIVYLRRIMYILPSCIIEYALQRRDTYFFYFTYLFVQSNEIHSNYDRPTMINVSYCFSADFATVMDQPMGIKYDQLV